MQTTNETNAGATGTRPLITVGVLTRDSADTLIHTLRSLATQTLPKASWEALFIDHSSSDGSRQLLETFVTEAANARLISRQENNIAASRQLVLEQCRADWLVFVDSDVTLPADWLAKALAFAERRKTAPLFAGVSGPLVILPRSPRLAPVARLQSRFAGHVATEQLSLSRVVRRASHLPTSAALFSAKILRAAGGFRADLGNCGEDLELGTRLHLSGLELWIEPSLSATHTLSCDTLADWGRRAFRFGRARVRVAAIHRSLWYGRQIVIPLSLSSLQLAGIALSILQPRGAAAGVLTATALAHVFILACLFLEPKRLSFGLHAAFIAWVTHEAYAWGELYETLRLTLETAIRKSDALARRRRFFRRPDRVEDLALP